MNMLASFIFRAAIRSRSPLRLMHHQWCVLATSMISCRWCLRLLLHRSPTACTSAKPAARLHRIAAPALCTTCVGYYPSHAGALGTRGAFVVPSPAVRPRPADDLRNWSTGGKRTRPRHRLWAALLFSPPALPVTAYSIV